MGKRTYAEYKGKIYTWLELLEKWNYYHNEHSNARPEVYKQASAKRLEYLKCMIKDEDGEFLEICPNCEELIDNCECGNNEDDGGEYDDFHNCVTESKKNINSNKDCGILLILSTTKFTDIKITIYKLTKKDKTFYEIKSEPIDNSKKTGYFLSPGTYRIYFYKNNNELLRKHATIYKNKVTGIAITNELDKLEQETFEKNQRLEREKLEQLREENRLRLEKEKSDKQKLEQERLLQERIEKSRNLEKEKLEQEKLEQEKRLEEWRLSDQENCEKKNYISVRNGKYLVRPEGCDSSTIKYNTNGNGDESDNYTESSGKKIRTYARLSNNECIKWVELLQRCNLYHNPRRSAYEEWREYIRKDINLPKVDRVDSSGNIIPDKTRPILKQSDKANIWKRYFQNTLKGICPCCKDINNNEINFGWFIIGHNIPFSKGGSSEIDNLIPICGECNNGMGDRYTIIEYRKLLKGANGLKLELESI